MRSGVAAGLRHQCAGRIDQQGIPHRSRATRDPTICCLPFRPRSAGIAQFVEHHPNRTLGRLTQCLLAVAVGMAADQILRIRLCSQVRGG